MSLSIRIVRKAASHSYLRRPEDAPDWHNNDANNSIDTLSLMDGDVVLMTCKAQTVANGEGIIVGVKYRDTIAPGMFLIRAFVDPRLYKCQPHGIVGAMTIAGERIGDDSTTETNKLRWLVHDWKNHQGVDTRVAWSAGCFVIPDPSLESLNAILRSRGVAPGELISCELVEEE